METLKEYITNKLKELHIKLFVDNSYANTLEGTVEKFRDQVMYEQLKEIIRINTDWDHEEINIEVLKRIQMELLSRL